MDQPSEEMKMEKQKILNDFMERSDGWSDYHNFIEEYYPEEFKREQALLSSD